MMTIRKDFHFIFKRLNQPYSLIIVKYAILQL